MKKVYAYALPALMAGSLGVSSCNSVDDGMSLDEGPKMPKAEYFDFSTTKGIALNLNFGEIAANSLVSLYVNEPSGDAGEEAAFKIFTDAKGCFFRAKLRFLLVLTLCGCLLLLSDFLR